MEIKILFDSSSLNKRFLTGWGVSYLIDRRILFDTGEKASSLFKNMQNMEVTISDIEMVVISHDHWDHRGGLWKLLEENPNIKVCACPNFSKRFKNKIKSYGSRLIEVDKFSRIGEGIYSTGEISGRYAFRYISEQALVLETSKGVTILTGCAHPGIIRIIEKIKQNISDRIYLVLGGFHLVGKHGKTIRSIVGKFKRLGVEKVAPSHCTGKNAVKVFKKTYGDDFISVKVGQVIEI